MDEKLEKLAQEHFEYTMKTVPPYATIMGIHEYDSEMPDGSLSAEMDAKEKIRKFRDEVEKIDPATLTFEGGISREALLQNLNVGIFEDECHGKWKSYPGAGTNVGMAVQPIFSREFAPLPERLSLIADRLEKTPKYIESTKELITDPVSLWVELGMNEAASAGEFLKVVLETAKTEKVPEKTVNRLEKATRSTLESLDTYVKWLKDEIMPRSMANFAIGREGFDELIRLRDLGMSADEIYEFGEWALQDTRRRLDDICREIAPGRSVEEVRKMMAQDHPDTFEGVLQACRKSVAEARQFVIDTRYATMPPDEELVVEETPAFMRRITPTGAYMPAGRFDRKQVGRYYISPPSENGPGLDVHNYADIYNTSVHEGYPGHHLQLACANQNPSYARMQVMGFEFIEGWAHYCEEIVARMGFRNETAVMFERINDMVWRAVRIIVDVKLSRGDMTRDEAITMLSEVTGFSRGHAGIEVDRYTHNPGYQLSYLLGKKLIMDLRRDVEAGAGRYFDLTKFHDTMLYAGSLPIKFQRRLVEHAFNLNEQEIVQHPVMY